MSCKGRGCHAKEGDVMQRKGMWRHRWPDTIRQGRKNSPAKTGKQGKSNLLADKVKEGCASGTGVRKVVLLASSEDLCQRCIQLVLVLVIPCIVASCIVACCILSTLRFELGVIIVYLLSDESAVRNKHVLIERLLTAVHGNIEQWCKTPA